ncbi:MAG: hypothetical protein V3V31_09810 [Methylococcales bacterium]
MNSRQNDFWVVSFFLGVFSIVIANNGVFASSYKQLTIEEVIDRSELIFEGQVINKEYRKSFDNGRVYTYVTFEVLDVIKGHYDESVMELRYPGGRLGDRVLVVDDMDIPELSESGVYFVKSLEQKYVHPLAGWAQGHFLIENDKDGVGRIVSAGHKPVTGLMGVAPLKKAIIKSGNPADFAPINSVGVIATEKANLEEALTLDEMKERLKDLMARE